MPFTDESWDGPEAEASMTPEEFCSICLVDSNPSGGKKVKERCKLPVKKSPGAPYNRNAIRNAMGRIFQMKGVSAEDKRKAARRLVRLAREGKIEVGESVMRLAGMKK